MKPVEQLPALFVELQKMCDPYQFLNEFPMTRNEMNGLSLFEDDDHIFLEAAVPGIKPEQIHISLEKGLIYIKAENSIEQELKGKRVYYKSDNSYSYRIPLPMRIDEQAAPEAVCKDGILKITLTKSRSCKPMKIAVKAQ